VKRFFRYLPLPLLLGFALPLAQAQSEFNLAVGFGAAQDKAATAGVEGNPSSTNYFGPCTVGSADPTCIGPSKLNSFMMGFQGSLILWKHIGVGADVTFEPAKQAYVTYPASIISEGGYNLQSRATFFDIDAVVQPVRTPKVALQILGGIGDANLKFYAATTSTTAVIGTQSYSQYFGSSNHFQVHGGIGVALFVKGGLFVRPQIDIHYVNNMTQFGSNIVTEETVWLGYNWGSH
jgi:hypothetical protein